MLDLAKEIFKRKTPEERIKEALDILNKDVKVPGPEYDRWSTRWLLTDAFGRQRRFSIKRRAEIKRATSAIFNLAPSVAAHDPVLALEASYRLIKRNPPGEIKNFFVAPDNEEIKRLMFELVPSAVVQNPILALEAIMAVKAGSNPNLYEFKRDKPKLESLQAQTIGTVFEHDPVAGLPAIFIFLKDYTYPRPMPIENDPVYIKMQNMINVALEMPSVATVVTAAKDDDILRWIGTYYDRLSLKQWERLSSNLVESAPDAAAHLVNRLRVYSEDPYIAPRTDISRILPLALSITAEPSRSRPKPDFNLGDRAP